MPELVFVFPMLYQFRSNISNVTSTVTVDASDNKASGFIGTATGTVVLDTINVLTTIKGSGDVAGLIESASDDANITIDDSIIKAMLFAGFLIIMMLVWSDLDHENVSIKLSKFLQWTLNQFIQEVIYWI